MSELAPRKRTLSETDTHPSQRVEREAFRLRVPVGTRAASTRGASVDRPGRAPVLSAMLAAMLLSVAWAPTPLSRVAVAARAPLPRMDYGDGYYIAAAPGSLPDNVFEVTLKRPLGIQFEEDGPIIGKNGVSVIGVVDGGNAAKDGTVQAGDKLVGVTAVQFIGSKWERKMFDARKWDFDTVVDAIGSNEEKFDIYDVVLQLERTSS